MSKKAFRQIPMALILTAGNPLLASYFAGQRGHGYGYWAIAQTKQISAALFVLGCILIAALRHELPHFRWYVYATIFYGVLLLWWSDILSQLLA